MAVLHKKTVCCQGGQPDDPDTYDEESEANDDESDAGKDDQDSDVEITGEIVGQDIPVSNALPSPDSQPIFLESPGRSPQHQPVQDPPAEQPADESPEPRYGLGPLVSFCRPSKVVCDT